MTSLPDSIISVFLDKQTRILKDTEVSTALVNQGIPCNVEDVRRHVRLLSPGLFQLTFNEDGKVIICVEPKIEICEEFLGNHCSAAAKTCEKLHICRHFEGNCPAPMCRFPHDFSKGINRKIVTQNNCQHINPVLLVKFLRFNKSLSTSSSSRPPYIRGHRGGRGRNRGGRGRGRGGRFSNHHTFPKFSAQKDDPNRQVDVSFPSSNLAQQIDMEMIEIFLNLHDINIEDKFNENENEYFRRVTIQLKEINDVEKLLISPIFNYHGVDIKFKRTKQIIDKTSFILKTSINNEQDKISLTRFKLYIDTLFEDKLIHIDSDRSSTSEQIILVQCQSEINFDKIRLKYESKPQLSNKPITFIQIYECDTLEIYSNDENKSITEDDLKNLFKSIWKDIFAYNFPSNNHAEIEFINNNAFKQWMSTIEQIQNKFNVKIDPIIDSVDENNDTRSTSSSQTVPSNIDTHSIVSAGFPQTKIKLPSDWAMIVTHPKFQLEYKEFIQNEFGGEININGNEVIYNGNFPKYIHTSNNEVILGNKTQDFMKKFEYKTFSKLEQNHIDILRMNSSTIAFNRTNDNDYIVATRLHEMSELNSKLFVKTNQRSPSEQPYSPNLPVTSSSAISTFMYPVNKREQICMFSIDLFEDRLRQYFQEIFNVKTIIERNNDKNKGTKNNIFIKLTGQTNFVKNASQDLDNLFNSLRTKKFDDKTSNWTKIEEATQVIQYHFKLINLICACEYISPTNIYIYFFDITNPQFGIDEEKIEDLIKDKFQSVIISYNQQIISSKFIKDWTNLEDEIHKRNDYKKNICLYKELNTLYLFGITELIKEFQQKFQQLIHKYDPQPFKIILTERQLNYLTYVAKADMNKLEKQYKSDGCDVSLTRLRHSSDFIAPADMHSKIKDSIEALAQIRDISFEINEPGFEILVSKESDRLINLVKSKCFLEKKIETQRIYIPIPKAHVQDPEPQGASATASVIPNVTSVNINHSTVTISIGDLTAQTVDAIVACTSSEYLCNSIVDKAGVQVQKEYSLLKSSGQFPGTTSAGILPCKKIFFIPWSSNSHDPADVKSSLNSFISIAFMQAISEGYKSIAFPAVGCGQLNFDPIIIAKYMLHETHKQLLIPKRKMNISFILLSEQKNVYDAFIKRLNEMHTLDPTVSNKIPTKKQDDQSTISYDKKIIKITLISSNDHHLIKCKEDILNLARSFSIKSQLTNKQDMLDWSQNTIYKYYEYCLKQHVIPTLDLANVTLELIGSKDAVHEAEKYFYELTSETFKQARIHAVSRGVIWSVELKLNSDIWEQYSFKLNGIIEDAYLKKHSHIDFENDKEEKCQIIFNVMEEHNKTKIRRIRRKLVDSTLPDTWESSDQNCKRVILKSSSEEYQKVLAQFHITMLGKYSQIVKIERIQNERWYKQYAAHRDDFQRRYPQLDERLLFHGCPNTSADKIIQECFNRSFAGVNGVLYGHGVYFHTQASYSHQYAQQNGSGERTMFLARVLIGKTCKGDQSMKVAPTGYDTTTDGQHIFVVYHDAGAYADHLITYK